MSTQTGKTYYCDANGQTLQENGIHVNLTECVSSYEYITPKAYNEMITALKTIHDFGQYDDVERKPIISHLITNINGADVLVKKTQNAYIQPDLYNNIQISLNKTRRESQYNIIYGTYFDNLVNNIKNYNIPSTRYYTYTYTCCDCDGDCCDGYSCEDQWGGGGGVCSMCISCDDYHCGGSQMGRG